MQNQFLPSEASTDYVPVVVPSVTSSETETAQRSSPQAVSAQAIISEQAVTDLLAQAQRQVRRRKRVFRTAEAVAAVVWLSWFPLLFVIGPEQISLLLWLVPLLLLSLAGIFFPMSFVFDAFAPDALAQAGGPQAIPVLLDALAVIGTSRERASLVRAVELLLPQMQAADAHLLTPGNRRLLNRWLTGYLNVGRATTTDGAVYLAVLKAYERVGDATAVPIVKSLANIHPRNECEQKIHQAAQECLPLLQTYVTSTKPVHTLLRASMPDTNTPDVLLRPASATLTPDAELLRAASADDAPPTT